VFGLRRNSLKNELDHDLFTHFFILFVECNGLIHRHIIPHKLIISASMRNENQPLLFHLIWGIDSWCTISSIIVWFLNINSSRMVWFLSVNAIQRKHHLRNKHAHTIYNVICDDGSIHFISQNKEKKARSKIIPQTEHPFSHVNMWLMFFFLTQNSMEANIVDC